MSVDDAIRSTNDDATGCKKYAVQMHYWEDPYIHFFQRNTQRKPPEISRGYYARVQGIKILLERFLAATSGFCQIVNLGAGFDTTFWNLANSGHKVKRFIEVDFPDITMRKIHYIKASKELSAALTGYISYSPTDIHSENYHLVAADLRNLQEFKQKMLDATIDCNLPTLFLSECVLVYLEADKSHLLLKWISDNLKAAFFINYEQVNMNDRFADVMIANLRSRNCILYGIQHCQSLETQKLRFQTSGWEGADAWDMVTVYQHLPPKEISRIEKLEFLDEKELLVQLFQHYCICWAYKDYDSIGLGTLSIDVD